MKLYFIFSAIVALLFFSCANQEKVDESGNEPEIKHGSDSIVEPALQSIIDSSLVSGSVVVYDTQNDCYISNDFKWAKVERLPASTFKITNSIIALETGVVENDSTLFPWDGKDRRLDIWEQDLVFRDAFHFSCVPCYQEIARKIGPERMKIYLDTLQYGNMIVDSSCIDVFWLEGESGISQFQQIDFLKRFYNSELPVSERTEELMKRLMVIEQNEHFVLSGKTGWAIRNGLNNGWFVGYVEKEGNVYFFATNVEPKEAFNMDLFSKIRKEITEKALIYLKIIEKND